MLPARRPALACKPARMGDETREPRRNPAAPRACTTEVHRSGLDRHPRAPRHRRPRPARDALDQYRHALQHHLPELLHRIEPQQRSAGLHHRRGGGRLLRRDRGPSPRHARDRVHGRRAVHEPRPAGDGGRCAAPRLGGAGAVERHAAHAAPEDQARHPGARPPPRPAAHHPRQPRSLRAGVARGGAWRAHLGDARSPASTG